MKILIVVIISLSIGFFIKPVDYIKQKELYDLLIQISSIVLAIGGAWLAVVFPDSFKNILNYKNDYKNDFVIVKALVNITISSLIVLMTVTFIKLSAMIMMNIPLFLEYKDFLKQISLSILSGLYFYEFYILLLVIFPIREIFKKADKENKKNELIDKKHGE